ncbi:hypothetical protein T1E_1322 [Pseudomonas putida DOT-T1E]|uniref:RanBP2-type domain-containing protein n=2 Tax=Pseudomonas putida TaxID=303 RepID=I7BSS2_PSEPT|nr:hypothetical protein T1E_1322 [Pseudomonas putida DOT-T1E]
MVSVLHREDRYIVIKRSDLDKIPGKQRIEFSKASRVAHERMFAAGAPPRQFLVIESDWPEYELAWASIEARVLGSGAAPLTGTRLLELHSSELRAARMETATLRAQLDERNELLRDSSGKLIRLAAHLISAPLFALQDLQDEDKKMTRARVDKAVDTADARLKDAAYELRRIADALSASAGPSSPTWSCQACQVEQPTDRACDACAGQTALITARS